MSSPMRTLSRRMARQTGTLGHKRQMKVANKAQLRIDREQAARKAAKKAAKTDKRKGIVSRIRSALQRKEG